MDDVEVVPVRGDVEIRVEERGLAPSRDQQRAVDELWRAEQKRRGKDLFNGALLEFVRHDASAIVGRFIEYKEYLASRLAPGLLGRDVFPLAVSGLTTSRGAVGFGRRSDRVQSYPGWFELFPSGGIDRRFLDGDRVDYRRQLLSELEEEAGVVGSLVIRAEPFALVFDRQGGVYDLCMEIEVDAGAERALTARAGDGGPEYSSLSFIPRAGLGVFLAEHSGRILPTSLAILRDRSLLPGESRPD